MNQVKRTALLYDLNKAGFSLTLDDFSSTKQLVKLHRMLRSGELQETLDVLEKMREKDEAAWR